MFLCKDVCSKKACQRKDMWETTFFGLAFFGLGLVAQASLLADNKSVKGVRCNLTIVAPSPQLQGDSKEMQMLIIPNKCEERCNSWLWLWVDNRKDAWPQQITGYCNWWPNFQAYRAKEREAFSGSVWGWWPGSLTKHTSDTMMYSIKKESNSNQSLKMSKKIPNTDPSTSHLWLFCCLQTLSKYEITPTASKTTSAPHSTPSLATPPPESVPEELSPVDALNASHQLLQAKVSLVDIGNF